jgi:hypothetical protein
MVEDFVNGVFSELFLKSIPTLFDTFECRRLVAFNWNNQSSAKQTISSILKSLDCLSREPNDRLTRT